MCKCINTIILQNKDCQHVKGQSYYQLSLFSDISGQYCCFGRPPGGCYGWVRDGLLDEATRCTKSTRAGYLRRWSTVSPGDALS